MAEFTDWKNEHLWSDGWRIKGRMMDAFTTSIRLVTGLRFHVHVYTTINIPAVGMHNGMDRSRFAYTPKFMCRCGHVLANGGQAINELFK